MSIIGMLKRSDGMLYVYQKSGSMIVPEVIPADMPAECTYTAWTTPKIVRAQVKQICRKLRHKGLVVIRAWTDADGGVRAYKLRSEQ